MSRNTLNLLRPLTNARPTYTRISPISMSESAFSRSTLRSEIVRPISGSGLKKRNLHTTIPRQHGEITRPEPGTGIKLTFKDSKGNEIKTIEGNEGDDILSLAHEYDVDLEGACEGSVACSTCHVIIDPENYDKLPEPDDEENDMLDLAFGLEDTSRLGCQVKLSKELDGMVATLPSATRNMYVDGAKARTH
ncbi:adrenodoxin-type ferredoxin [Kwoniella mangroviensis CBS 8886]|nr:adrenodoxin-type ferredoxin [Kwoniella mangroviensis CBS 8886]